MSDNFEKEDNEYALDGIPKEKRYLNSMSYDYSVQFLYDLMKKGKIILEVPFQRKEIWKRDKSSSLIESIIMNVPIPPLYFAEEDDGNWLVLDGLQRLSSIKNFYDNEYSLFNLQVLEELNKCKYKDLPQKSKGLLDDGLLRVNVIKKDSHPDIKYDIFMRLNQGAVTLNYQELRNCLYRGNLNNVAKELCEENKDFLKILGQKKPHQRYLDVEFIIRFFAINDNVCKDVDGSIFLKDYKGKLVQYLNNYMKNNSDKVFDLNKKQEYKNKFNSTIEKIITVFGTDKAFRDISSDNSKVYKTIADFIMPSFARMSLECVQNNKEELYQRLYNFLKREDVKDTLYIKTSDKEVMNKRIQLWFREIEDVVQL